METNEILRNAHKGKNNTLFGTVKGLFLFVRTHNIKKT